MLAVILCFYSIRKAVDIKLCQIHKLAHSLCEKNLSYAHGKTDSAVVVHNFDLHLWALKAELHNFL